MKSSSEMPEMGIPVAPELRSGRTARWLVVVAVMIAATAWFFSQSPANAKPMLSFTPGNSYTSDWTRVDSLTDEGLYKSALDLTNAIHTKAVKENNAAQQVKALMYRFRLSQNFEEYSEAKAINDVRTEIKRAKFPVTPVLHSVLGSLYWQYYEQHRWEFGQRSATSDIKDDDIATWDLKTLVEHTLAEYNASLENADSLQRSSREVFLPVLEEGDKTAANLRPTLYDFLAHRAIDFYSNEEAAVTRPAERFVVDQDAYFGKTADFVQLKLETKDTLALRFYALRHLQALVKFRLADAANEDALVDADLKRLQLVHANSISEIKDTLFKQALSALAANHPKSPISGDVMYTLARHYQAMSPQKLTPDTENKRDYLKRAVELCKEVQQRYPKSQGATNCLALATEIQQASHSLLTETSAMPDEVSRVRLEWQNTKKLYFRVVADPRNLNDPESFDDTRERITEYLKRKVVTTWEQVLPDEGDYRQHTAEMKVPALPAGRYLILSSVKPEFPIDTNLVSVANLNVSELTYVSRRLENGTQEYVVMNRKTGEPLPGITAYLWENRYDYMRRRHDFRKEETLKSNADGFVLLTPKSNNGANYILEFVRGNNHTFTDDLYLYKYNRAPKQTRPQTFFFTDRSIYRPGQTVYFKGILIETDGDSHRILPNTNTTVLLYDVNYQKVAEVELKSNAYGSVAGSFIAPMNGITGQMHLQNESGSQYFSVEEYKRPKFEVTTEPVKGAFRLNETVEIRGAAKTYAGSVVDNAEVQYRVVRNVRYPWWWYEWRGGSSGNATEILSGKVMTNDTGGYVIPFTALPDRTVSRKSKPTFNYVVTIDVTDQSGETHSTTAYVNVGYTALQVSLGIDERMSQEDTTGVSLSVTNLMGTPEAATIQVKITRLEAPKRQLRNRPWDVCEKQLYTEAEWNALFPNDPYKEEHLTRNWKKGAVVFTQTVAGDKLKPVRLTGKEKWMPGMYVAEATTKDKYGEEVTDVRYFTLFGEKSKTPPESDTPFWFEGIKTACKPGEKAVFLMGTTAKDVRVLYEIEHQEKTVSRQWLKLSNEQRRIEIPVEEKHRGNFSVHVLMLVNGREYHQDQTISVGWESKALDISLATFRDKLTPGQPEEWKLTVKGITGDKVMAELVAGMYDASLDAFQGHSWNFGLWRSNYGSTYWQNGDQAEVRSSWMWTGNGWYTGTSYDFREYDQLNTFGFSLSSYGYGDGAPGRGPIMFDALYYKESLGNVRERGEDDEKSSPAPPPGLKSIAAATTANTVSGNGAAEKQQQEGRIDKNKEGEQSQLGGADVPNLGAVKARTNLGETAFFFPQLETDANGDVVLKFTAPEALTRWRFMAFAHTKELHYAQISREVVTQKELMVMPNVPRFLRESDKITITAKVANLSAADMTGNAQLFLFDALSMKPIDVQLGNTAATVSFSAKKGQSTAVAWSLSIPEGIGAVQYRIVAAANNFSDGEEAALPVLTNRMLVTETLPLPINGGQTKEFRFEKLLSSGKGSSTLRNHRLTLEFTSNPAWYGVQALPYLMEYPYECAEQTFSRFYANSIATHVANSSPKIRAVFDAWKNRSPDAFLSNLEKNQELKSLMLEETPWVLNAQDESERKRRVGLLFDVNRMANEQDRSLRQLAQMQESNGGWSWFKGMPDDRYITQHIITGMGHLDHLGVKSVREDGRTWNMVQDGVRYLDNRIREDYDNMLKYDKVNKDKNHLGYLQIQYLYARSYFKDIEVEKRNKEAFDYYLGQSKKYWLPQGRYMQGMIALALKRYDDPKTPIAIMKSLKETALQSEEMGMYWKENSGWYWYQAPIESQAVMIEAFDEVSNDQKSVDALRVWLLKNKQTNDWKTTKATAEACYALLLRGTSWLATESDVQIIVGNKVVDPKQLDTPVEAGTGYFKTAWTGGDITPEMGKIKVTKTGPGVSWGAMYWQYFEQLDKITPAQSPMQVKKQLYRVRNTASGPVLDAITESTELKPGDKVRVRIELRNDRDLEYVHLKDMRASGFEPVNVLSQYKYQDGLGYYESTRDAATNFFFGFLPKGVHIFEYPLTVVHAGDFSNGITSVQCMYAPEFAAHSAGTRVKVVR